jgi:hypothetical protein
MPNQEPDYSHIKGWGVDADPENDPTYPMKKRNNGEHRGYTWQRPTQQPRGVEVLQSNERPNLPSVFGTSTPPAGLSGMIRRFAFKYSESSYGHWLPLMLADRVSVVEGIASDVLHGHLPNIPSELGWGAEWKFNRRSLVTRLAVGSILVAALVSWIGHESKTKR